MSEYIYTTEGTFGLRECTGEEIVRCRDCRFSPDDGQTCERDGDEFNVTLVRPDGFCAWGESAWVTCKCGEDIEKLGRIQICPSCGRVVFA